MTAKETSWLPNSENACPVQMVKKRGAQGFDFSGAAVDIIMIPFSQMIYHRYFKLYTIFLICQ
jgi:hypothetical protein